MSSVYPDSLDIFTRLVNEYDRPTANWWNQLFSALISIQEALGIDPSDLGTGFGSFSSIGDILGHFALVEVGEFELEIPANDPLRVLFKSGEDRWDVANDMTVLCNMKLNKTGRKVSPDARHSARVVLGPGGDPYGFDFYRTDMDNASGTIEGRTETWSYMAIEENM